MIDHFWLFMSWAFGLYALGLFAASVAHEGGHFLCAKICSMQVARIAIGSGPLLVRGRVGATQVELRLLPVGGFVIPVALPDLQQRWPIALFLLGGVLGNLAAAAALAWLHAGGAVPIVLHDEIGPLALFQVGILVGAQIVLMVVALIPHRGSIEGRPVGSDGLQLLNLALGRYLFAELLQPYQRGTARRSPPSPALPRIAQELARSHRWSADQGRRNVCAVLRRELEEGGLPPEEEMLVLDALVTDGLLFADPALRAHLDQWSLRALELGPDIETLAGSRGSVLVELGRYQEGKALLEPVAFDPKATPFDTLISRIFLARAEHALGNTSAAVGLLSQARSSMPSLGASGPPLVALMERVEREVRSDRTPTASDRPS